MQAVVEKKYEDNLKGLEILRFLLSISVIIFHYQHFFHPLSSAPQKPLYEGKQPFYDLFQFVYTYGYYAVPIFWLISGVVFYKVYSAVIFYKEISFKAFALNRFSRLFPLHLLTLFAVLGLQSLMINKYGHFFIYQSNSIKNFFQNLLFVQSWGITQFSFNGPSWSVSVELVVYLLFFLICSSGFLNKTKGLILTLAFCALVKKWELLFIRDDFRFCMLMFFAGCLFIKGYDLIKHKVQLQWILLASFILLALLGLYTPEIIFPIYDKVTGRLDLNILWIGLILILSFIMFFNLSFFNRISPRHFRFWGDITYSTYLIHFPVQIALFLCLKFNNNAVFYDKKIFFGYLIIVVVLGRLLFIGFERPLNRYIRTLYKR